MQRPRVKSKLVHLGNHEGQRWGLGAIWAAWGKGQCSLLNPDTPGWGGREGCRQMCIFQRRQLLSLVWGEQRWKVVAPLRAQSWLWIEQALLRARELMEAGRAGE